MSRLTVMVDDGILAEAREALGTRTKRETILAALREASRRRKLKRALDHCGRIELGLSQEELAQLREEP